MISAITLSAVLSSGSAPLAARFASRLRVPAQHHRPARRLGHADIGHDQHRTLAGHGDVFRQVGRCGRRPRVRFGLPDDDEIGRARLEPRTTSSTYPSATRHSLETALLPTTSLKAAVAMASSAFTAVLVGPVEAVHRRAGIGEGRGLEGLADMQADDVRRRSAVARSSGDLETARTCRGRRRNAPRSSCSPWHPPGCRERTTNGRGGGCEIRPPARAARRFPRRPGQLCSRR